jgi:TfoX/Sxy family transcriptional regulator of competence genes
VAYDEQLAERVRDLISAHGRVEERKMFGGIAFMLDGHMAVGVLGEELIVRVGPEDASKALAEPGVREFDFTGRPAKGLVFVAAEATSSDEQLEQWVEAGAGYAASLPPKSR